MRRNVGIRGWGLVAALVVTAGLVGGRPPAERGPERWEVGSHAPGAGRAVARGVGSPSAWPTAVPPVGGPVWVEREVYAMGTRLRVRLLAPDRGSGFAAIERVVGEVEAWEARLSTWREGTELGRLNAAPPGVWVPLAPEVFSLLREVVAWRDRTAGAFDPAVGPWVEAWDLRGAGRRPDAAARARARAAARLDRFEWDDSGRRARRLHEGAWLDAGGFGKGAALRSAAAALRSLGVRDAYLDFGGQVLALGSAPGGGPWVVGVAHPARRDRAVCALALRDGSVATSGASERFVVVDGERWGHVVDPRAGRPVPAWGSATVVAADPLVADVLSTALFVLGPVEARAWAEAHAREWGTAVILASSRPGGAVRVWAMPLPGAAPRPGAAPVTETGPAVGTGGEAVSASEWTWKPNDEEGECWTAFASHRAS